MHGYSHHSFTFWLLPTAAPKVPLNAASAATLGPAEPSSEAARAWMQLGGGGGNDGGGGGGNGGGWLDAIEPFAEPRPEAKASR